MMYMMKRPTALSASNVCASAGIRANKLVWALAPIRRALPLEESIHLEQSRILKIFYSNKSCTGSFFRAQQLPSKVTSPSKVVVFVPHRTPDLTPIDRLPLISTAATTIISATTAAVELYLLLFVFTCCLNGRCVCFEIHRGNCCKRGAFYTRAFNLYALVDHSALSLSDRLRIASVIDSSKKYPEIYNLYYRLQCEMLRQRHLIRGLAGHSHYHNIRHRKAKVDARRQSAFQKLSRDIYAAIKAGGGSEPAANARLARALEAARRGSLPKERIERALQSGTRRMSEGTVVFEGVFPGGIGVMVRTSDGRRNGVAGEMRALFSKADGEVGRAGWLFVEKHVVVVPNGGEEMALCGMEEGAEDIEISDEGVEIICSSIGEREQVKKVVAERFEIEGVYGEKRMEARGMVAVDGEQCEKLKGLFQKLDGHEDVFEVIHNAEFVDDDEG